MKYIPVLLIIAALAFILVRYFYMKPRYVNGEIAPEVTGSLKNGDTFRLSDLRGKLVLLDFWGSWCAPCRAENPQLVKLYDKFRNANFKNANGFEIVSIGIETKKDRWLRAIEKDELKWPYHIFDHAESLRFFDSEIASSYSVKQVPSKFLINEYGMIIGVNQSLKEIDRVLTGQTKKN